MFKTIPLKKIITILFFTSFSINLNAGTITVTGACACNQKIGDIFTEIDDYIVDDNLKEINDALDKPLEALDNKIAKLQKESEILDGVIEKNRQELAYLEQLVFLIEQEKQIRSKHKVNKDITNE